MGCTFLGLTKHGLNLFLRPVRKWVAPFLWLYLGPQTKMVWKVAKLHALGTNTWLIFRPKHLRPRRDELPCLKHVVQEPDAIPQHLLVLSSNPDVVHARVRVCLF